MTCQDLDEQIEMLGGSLASLNSMISDKQGQIDDQILVCIASDSWPGGPPTTWDAESIQVRQQYLSLYMMFHPEYSGAIYATLEKYGALQTLLQQKASLVAQAADVQQQLNDLLLQKQQQGCP